MTETQQQNAADRRSADEIRDDIREFLRLLARRIVLRLKEAQDRLRVNAGASNRPQGRRDPDSSIPEPCTAPDSE